MQDGELVIGEVQIGDHLNRPHKHEAGNFSKFRGLSDRGSCAADLALRSLRRGSCPQIMRRGTSDRGPCAAERVTVDFSKLQSLRLFLFLGGAALPSQR